MRLLHYIPQTKRKTIDKSENSGDRTFKVAAPKLRNSLPEDMHSSNDVSVFKSKLKTHYFSIAFN